MSAYILSDAALKDMRGIIRYTEGHWGAAQAARYARILEKGMLDLAENRIRYRTMDYFSLPLRMAHVGRHYLFLFMRENAPALAAAIYHERSNYMEHLFSRITPDFIKSGGKQA